MQRLLFALPLLAALAFGAEPQSEQARDRGPMKVCATQPATTTIDWHLTAEEVLGEVDKYLTELESMVRRAGSAGCDALALPEDALGLLPWEVSHRESLNDVLPEAVARMIDRLGRTAAEYDMYLVSSSDLSAPDGSYRNTAFFLGRDGREIGRYVKVHPTVHESDREKGMSFPVFETRDLGGVGLLICYDLVMPESTRSLALNGADVIFVSTLGGAATTGGADMYRAASRTRAVDNYVYLVISKRTWGSMIISPQGEILAEGKEPGDIVMAEINPFGGREGGDSHNMQRDMRARLFRERNPAAYQVLTNPNPPVFDKIPPTMTVSEGVRIFRGSLTTGAERLHQAEALLEDGKIKEAAQVYEALCDEFPASWIDRTATQRLESIRSGGESGAGNP